MFWMDVSGCGYRAPGSIGVCAILGGVVAERAYEYEYGRIALRPTNCCRVLEIDKRTVTYRYIQPNGITLACSVASSFAFVACVTSLTTVGRWKEGTVRKRRTLLRRLRFAPFTKATDSCSVSAVPANLPGSARAAKEAFWELGCKEVALFGD